MWRSPRNLPPLFQIMFWYIAVLAALPGPRQSIGFGLQPLLNVLGDGLNAVGLASVGASLKALAGGVSSPGVFLNNRGLVIPRAIFGEGAVRVLAFVVALVLVFVLAAGQAPPRATGQQFPSSGPRLRFSSPAVPHRAALGFPVTFEKPELRGFNFAGGVRVIPELVSLLLALSIYTAGFIAETVRSGILAVSKGQTEAAHSLASRAG